MSTEEETLLGEARKEIKALRDELFTTRRSTWEATKNAASMTAQLTEAQAEIHNLKERAAEGEASTKQLRIISVQLAELRDSHEGDLHEIRKHRAARVVLDEELSNARQSAESLTHQVAELQGEKARATDQLHNQTAQVMLLKKQLAEAEEEVGAVEDELQSLKQSRRQTASAPESTPPSEATTQNVEIETYIFKNEELKQALTLAHTQATDSDNECQMLKAELERMREQVDKPEVSSSNEQTSSNLLQTQLQDALERVTVLETQLATKQTQESRPSLRIGPPAPAPASQAAPASNTSSIGGDTTLSSLLGMTSGELREQSTEQLVTTIQQAVIMQEQYKRSRDKLLGEVNRQSVEMERLQSQSSVMTTSLQDAEALCDAWQAQTQAALLQIDRLKECTDDQIQSDAAEVTQPGSPNKTELVLQETPTGCSSCTAAQRQILEQTSRIAQLDLQMRAMKAEVLRSTQLSAQMGRAVLPSLYSIESRLLDLPGLT